MTKVKNTAVIIKDDKVPNIIAILEDKLKGLQSIVDTQWKTTGELEGFGNIKNENKVENLIRAYSIVTFKGERYDKAGDELMQGAPYPAFIYSGGTVEDWKADINLRLAILTHKETFDRLTGYKEKMSKFLSEADQKAMLVDEMATFLATLK